MDIIHNNFISAVQLNRLGYFLRCNMQIPRVSVRASSVALLLCVSANVFGETVMQQHAGMEDSAIPVSHGMHRPSHHSPIGI
ncbi:MAG: hypothetical protein P8M18_04575, partial [Woeseiaceae bacterium]|nr:hypothetical protein [Woeseiaceae bacterium]